MIGMVLAIALQAKGYAVLADNQRFFKTYKICVTEYALQHERSGESIETIIKAALSNCRSVKLHVLIDMFENMTKKMPDDLDPKKSEAFDGSDQFEVFEEQLKEDVAAKLMKIREK